MNNTVIMRVNLDPYKPLQLAVRDLMWFQRQHDKNYHHDIYVMPTMKRIQHLVNHINKYYHVQFKEHSATTNNQKQYKDTLSCLLSICGTLGFNPFKGADGAFGAIDISKYDRYAANMHFRDALCRITKALEGFDHIEDIDYRGVMQESLVVMMETLVTMAVYGFNGMAIVDEDLEGKTQKDKMQELLSDWYDNLVNIKLRHCFYDYFELETKNCQVSKDVRLAFARPRRPPQHK